MAKATQKGSYMHVNSFDNMHESNMAMEEKKMKI
jgi:hypothetical protein